MLSNSEESWKKYFPYEPRPLQRTIMNFIEKKGIKENTHFVLEAANGTGKTISLLSLVIPYAERYDKKIVYLARTHSQIDRVIDELEEISEKKEGVKVNGVGLRGRGALCLNSMVKEYANNNRAVQEMCQQLKTSKKCEYWNNMSDEKRVLPLIKEISMRPVNAEIILEMADAAYVCPSETAKLALSTVNVVACSYLYIFDHNIRKIFLEQLNCDLKDVILIVDECHNLAENINQINSDEIRSFSIRQALREARLYRENKIEYFLETLENNIEKLVGTMGNKYELRIDPAMFLDQLEIDFNDVNYYDTTIDEDFFIEMIEAGSIIRNRLAKQDKEPRSFIGRIGEFLYKWHENIGKVEYSFSLEKTMTGEYKNAILKISSLDPSIVSYEILDNLHSSFSMSGSLGDPDAYSLLLGLNRLNTITNILPSPYKSNNIQTVITKSLTTSYNKRSDMMWMKYVHSIVSIVENTPKNIGIFTPSYTILKKIMDSGLENKISKPIYEIKRGMSSDDNDKIVSKFKNEADNNGAVLISVLGGRSSEGADFPGEYMQSVIVIGIPYAPPSVQTQSQIEYLESKFPKKGRALAYQIPAINRASQAAGRPVRSLNDVAFIMLGDERFSQKNVFEQLPGWIRDSVERIDYNPNELGKKVDDFYKNMI